MKNIISNVKNSDTAKAWAADFGVLTDDSLRAANATTVAAMRSTALTMRAASITVETLNVGLGAALEHTPKTYEETKKGIGSLMDSIMEMMDEEEEEKKEEVKVK